MVLRADADARVPDLEPKLCVFPVLLQDGYLDFHLAFGSEFNGVGGQIEEDLADPAGISHKALGDVRVAVGNQLEVFALGGFHHQSGHLFHQGPWIEGADVQVNLAGLELGEIEDVVDQAKQDLPGALDSLGVLALGFAELGVHHERGQANDRVERGADLVAHGGKELGLEAAGFQCGLAGVQEFGLGRFALGDVAGDGCHSVDAVGTPDGGDRD